MTTELDPARRGTGLVLALWGYTGFRPVAGIVSVAPAMGYMEAVDQRTLGICRQQAQPLDAPVGRV